MAYSLYKEIEYALDGIPDANLTDFPKRFKIVADAEIAAECSGGGGFKVTSADGMTDLPIEVLTSGTALASGNVEFWVKLSLLTAASVGDVVARIYYDGAETTVEDHAGVWSNNYARVLHLEQDPSGSAPQMYDSVSETNIGTSAGSMTSGDLVTGQVGDGLNFDGSDDYVAMSQSSISRPYTVEAIVKRAATGSFDSNFFSHDSGANDGVRLGISNTNDVRLTFGGVATYTFTGLTWPGDGNWAYLAYVVPANSGTAEAYLGDGSTFDSDSQSVGTMSGTPSQITIGGLSWFSANFDGLVDEVRVSSVARSADWLAYQYTDDFDNADTFTLSAELGGGGGPPATTSNLLLLGVG